MHGHIKELAVEAEKAAGGHLVLVVQVVQEWVFSKEHKIFSREGIRSPLHQISPRQRKTCSPLASEHLTPFFRLNVEEKMPLSPLPPSKPLLGGCIWLGGGQQVACSLATVLAASMSLIGDEGLFGCPEVPCQQLQQQHWLAHICHPSNELPVLPTP